MSQHNNINKTTTTSSSSSSIQQENRQPRKFNYNLIKHPLSKISFLITDCPSNQDLNDYAELLHSFQVPVVFRLCESTTYNSKYLIQEKNIDVIDDCAFEDGTTPNESILSTFRSTLHQFYSQNQNQNLTVAIHCISGIGRAPVLATVGLIDQTNLDPVNAVEYVRSIRRGALNKNQVNWILDKKYKSSSKRRPSLVKMFKKVISF